MADEYQMTKEAAQIDSIINGAVVANAATSLSEAEKAQARENIGASPVGSGLRVVAHFNTLAELEAAVTNPQIGDAYSVGTVKPYSLYLWDAISRSWRDYGFIRSEDITARIAQNVAVPASAWTEDTGNVFTDYPYKADISIAEVTADDFPIIAFEPFDALSGNLCPVAYTFSGKVEIFAKTIPTAAVTIPAITFIVAGDGGGSGTNDPTGDEVGLAFFFRVTVDDNDDVYLPDGLTINDVYGKFISGRPVVCIHQTTGDNLHMLTGVFRNSYGTTILCFECKTYSGKNGRALINIICLDTSAVNGDGYHMFRYAVDGNDYAPVSKTPAMTQPVGKDVDGRLWTTP